MIEKLKLIWPVARLGFRYLEDGDLWHSIEHNVPNSQFGPGAVRDFDWYRREGDLLIQNWVPIDIIDLYLQMDVDLFDRLRRQIELRKLGELWFMPSL